MRKDQRGTASPVFPSEFSMPGPFPCNSEGWENEGKLNNSYILQQLIDERLN